MVNKNTLNLIKHYESLHDGDLKKVGLQPKMDPVGIWTEGYGRAMIDPMTKKFLKGLGNKQRAYDLQTIHTEEEADKALVIDMVPYENEVERYAKSLGLVLNNDQFGALTSMCYNAGGIAAFKTMNRIKKDPSPDAIFNAFGLYNKGTINGKLEILPGLVFRRKSEANLFVTGTVKFYNQ